MGFASIVTLFFLAIGSTFPRQAVSLELQRSSSVEHHRTAREEHEFDCPDGLAWQRNNNNCYYFSSAANDLFKLNWTEAKVFCQTKLLVGEETVFLAELGSPGNAESDIWLMETIVKRGSPVWLGAQDYYGNNTWIWQHSQLPLSLSYPLWGPNQPNNHQGVKQNCLSTLENGDRTTTRQYLNDEICVEHLNYVCQLVLPFHTTK